MIPKKGKAYPLKIFARNHFSSGLKRMSVIAGSIISPSNVANHLPIPILKVHASGHLRRPSHCHREGGSRNHQINGLLSPLPSLITTCACVELKSVPADYDETFEGLSREGARVLALARKELGQLSHQEVRDLKRAEVEAGLDFAGFVAISCPLKPDTKAVIKEILASSHKVRPSS